MNAFAPPVPPPGRHHVCLSASLSCSGSNPCVLCRECTEQNVIGRAYELARLPLALIDTFRDMLAQAWVEFAHDAQTDPLFRERTLDLERTIICDSLEEAAAVKAWLDERRRVKTVPVPPATSFVAVQPGGGGGRGQTETVTVTSTSVELPVPVGPVVTVAGGTQHLIHSDGVNVAAEPVTAPAETEAYVRESVIKPSDHVEAVAPEASRTVPRLAPDERVRPMTAREVASHLRAVERVPEIGAETPEAEAAVAAAETPDPAELLNGAAGAETSLE